MSNYSINISEKSTNFGWNKHVLKEGILWFKGFLLGNEIHELGSNIFSIFKHKFSII